MFALTVHLDFSKLLLCQSHRSGCLFAWSNCPVVSLSRLCLGSHDEKTTALSFVRSRMFVQDECQERTPSAKCHPCRLHTIAMATAMSGAHISFRVNARNLKGETIVIQAKKQRQQEMREARVYRYFVH